MTEDTRTSFWEECIANEIEVAHSAWARQYAGKKSREEALSTARQQTIVTVTDQPGGRLLIYCEVYGKKPHTKTTTYNRYQRIPGQGYVRVYHRNM